MNNKFIHFIDQIAFGGAQTHLLTILKERKATHPDETHILAVLFDNAGMKELFENMDISVHCMGLREAFVSGKYKKVYDTIFLFIKQHSPQVVETHLTWSRLFANTAAYYCKIPIRVGFEHGDIYLKSFPVRTANFISQFYFHSIIVCSCSLKKWVHNTHKISNAKLHVHHNCVDLDKFTTTPEKKLDDIVNVNQHAFNFISVGTLGKGVNKRVDITIKALQLLKRNGITANLIICGDGEQKTDLETLSDELGLKDQVYFLGLRNDVEKILPHCDAFVHAAPYEPFGIVCLEAMASGLPVIIPNSGGIAEIITNQEDGLLYDPLNPKDLADKMYLLISDAKLYNSIKKSELQHVKNYSVSKYVETLYDTFYNN